MGLRDIRLLVLYCGRYDLAVVSTNLRQAIRITHADIVGE